jgi:hypothetical protein
VAHSTMTGSRRFGQWSLVRSGRIGPVFAAQSMGGRAWVLVERQLLDYGRLVCWCVLAESS